MEETKEDRKQRHKHHMTLGGVMHGVHHGVAHGHHTITAHRNVHENGRVKPNPHKGGAHGWVYTTKKGDTLASLQHRFWPGSNTSGGRGNPNLFTYANNKQLLKGKFFSQGGQWHIKPGTRIVA